MTQSEKTIQRLKKLYNHMESARQIGNEDEALAFAGKIEKLLVEHKLTMSDIEFAELDDSDPITRQYVDSSAIGLKDRQSKIKWQSNLAQACAKAHFCTILVHTGSNMVSFIGRDSDRKIAVYVYGRLARACEMIAKKEYRKHRKAGYITKGFLTSFRNGFVSAISNRYCEIERERRRQMQALGTKGTALIRLETEHAKAEKWMYANIRGIRNIAHRGRRTTNMAGYNSGVSHGKQADLRANVVEGGASKGAIRGS